MLDTKRYRPHQVLGDAERYQAALAAQRQQQGQPLQDQQLVPACRRDGLDAPGTIDTSSVPKDILAASQLLGQRGRPVLEIYQELLAHREAVVHHIKQSQQRAATTAGDVGYLGYTGSRFGFHHTTAAPGQLLSKRTVMDTIKEEHDERVLSRWAAQQAAWQQQAAALAAATGKEPEELTMERGGEWRRRLELIQALEVAVPAAGAAVHVVKQAHSTAASGNRSHKPGTMHGSSQDTDAAMSHAGSAGHVDKTGRWASSSAGSSDGAFAPAPIADNPGNWLTTLRNSNERFVQIGNVFSGLFLSVRGAGTAGLETITKPTPSWVALLGATAAAGDSSSGDGGHAARSRQLVQFSNFRQRHLHSNSNSTASSVAASSAAGSLAGTVSNNMSLAGSYRHHTTAGGSPVRKPWGASDYLQEKMAAGAVAVKALQPHTPDAGTLMVTGRSLINSGSYQMGGSIDSNSDAYAVDGAAADSLSGLAVRPVLLSDVEARLAVADAELFARYKAAQQAEAARLAAAVAAQAEQEAAAAAEAAAAQLPHQGPHLEPSTNRLTFKYVIPHSQTSSGGGGSQVAAAPHVAHVAARAPAAAVPASVAVLTVHSTGTAAVYYCWACQGRDRLLAPSSSHADAAAAGVDSAAAFYLPESKGVILPGETKQFKFLFKSSQPGIFHESWVMACHPRLIRTKHPVNSSTTAAPPCSNAGQHDQALHGHGLNLHLNGIAVLDGDVGGQLFVQQQQLEMRLAAQERDAKVAAVLNSLLDSVVGFQQQKQQQMQKQQQAARSIDAVEGSDSSRWDVEAAAKWAMANPPILLPAAAAAAAAGRPTLPSAAASTPKTPGAIAGGNDDAAFNAGSKTPRIPKVQSAAAADQAAVSCYYYSPDAAAQLREIYTKARAVLQPVPPSPPPEPKKGGAARTSMAAKGKEAAEVQAAAAAAAAVAVIVDADGNRLVLPGTWGMRISLVEAAVAALQREHKQEYAVLSQHLAAALAAVATPSNRRQLVEEACRHALLQLADAVPALAQTAKAAAVITCEAGSLSSTGGMTHRGTARHSMMPAVAAALSDEHSSSGAIDTVASSPKILAAAGTNSHSTGGTHKGGHKAEKAAAAGPLIDYALYRIAITEEVHAAARALLGGCEKLLGQHRAAVAAALDKQAAAALQALQQIQQLRQHQGAGTSKGDAVDERLAWRAFELMRKKQLLGI